MGAGVHLKIARVLSDYSLFKTLYGRFRGVLYQHSPTFLHSDIFQHSGFKGYPKIDTPLNWLGYNPTTLARLEPSNGKRLARFSTFKPSNVLKQNPLTVRV